MIFQEIIVCLYKSSLEICIYIYIRIHICIYIYIYVSFPAYVKNSNLTWDLWTLEKKKPLVSCPKGPHWKDLLWLGTPRAQGEYQPATTQGPERDDEGWRQKSGSSTYPSLKTKIPFQPWIFFMLGSIKVHWTFKSGKMGHADFPSGKILAGGGDPPCRFPLTGGLTNRQPLEKSPDWLTRGYTPEV